MARLGRILFPVDFSDRCLATARRVIFLAGRLHSEVILLHVLGPLRPDLAAFDLSCVIPDALAGLREHTRRELARFLERELADAEVCRILAEGDPAEAIVRHAEGLGADLIMMPTRGLGGFRRYVIGSVTAKVLHDANIPVWTGTHRESAAPRSSIAIEHIVCAVDLGPQSVKALAWASDLAGELNARVTLLHVAPDLEPAPGGEFDPDCRLSLMDWTHTELERIQGAVGARWDVRIESGEAAKGVVRGAGELKADLVVIGRSPDDGMYGRLRTHAYAIVGQSPCPVVSV